MKDSFRPKLSGRLLAVGRLVSDGARLCDVGCDHAYLCIDLVQKGRIANAIAMDVREGPLSIAQSNIHSAGLSEAIETRLSDGLSKLRAGEADTIVLAGMGGKLIIDILSRGRLVADAAKEWILQPQSDVAEVRRFVREAKRWIVSEKMMFERGKYYPIIKAAAGEQDAPPIEEDLSDAFGPLLLSDRHPLLFEFLKKEDGRLSEIWEMVRGRQDADSRRIFEEWQLVKRALAYFA